MEKIELKLAHRHSFNHRRLIEVSDACGCFSCLAIFLPSDITDWIDEKGGGATARCPRCDVDSVIGSAAGFPITKHFLGEMRKYWM